MIVGITGGVATGKSEVLCLLKQHGAITFSADEAARAVVSPNGHLLAEITRDFGPEVFEANGSLNRAALGRRVFNDAGALKRLNALMHPAIWKLLRVQIEAAKVDMPAGSTIVVEAPLLFETNMANWFERIVVVTASESTQISRMLYRNGLDEPEARKRLRSQWPLVEKSRRADFVIVNDGSIGDLVDAVNNVWESLKLSVPNCARNW